MNPKRVQELRLETYKFGGSEVRRSSEPFPGPMGSSKFDGKPEEGTHPHDGAEWNPGPATTTQNRT